MQKIELSEKNGPSNENNNSGKEEPSNENSDSQNDIENENYVEIFEEKTNLFKINDKEFKTVVYKDSNGKEFQTLFNTFYYTKDKNKEILFSHIEEKKNYYYFLIKEDKDYLIKSDIKHDKQNDSIDKKEELLSRIQENINKENKIKCEKWYSSKYKTYYFDEKNNNYENELDSLFIRAANLFVLTEKNNTKYAKPISLKDVKYLKD